MTLESPKGTTLQLIDGNPDDLLRSAKDLITSGEEMERSAARLEDISNGTSDLKSEAIAKLRENAGDVFPELRKAAIRYDGTGQALKKYSYALDRVQGALQMCTAEGGVDSYTTLNALITDIEDVHQSVQTKRSQEDTAEGAVDDADGFLGFSEGTDEEKAEAKSDLTEATAAREEAEEELRELWGKFDGRVSYWEDAYDEAVGEIEDAFKAADNDDKFLSTLGSVLGWIALGVGIAALFITSPVWGPIASAIAVIAAVAVVAIEVIKLVQGDGDWTSLLIAVVGIIPFGRFAGKAFSGLSKAFPSAIKAGSKAGPRNIIKAFSKTRSSTGRGIVRSSIKSGTKRPPKTTIRGNRPTKAKIRRNNRKIEQKYQQTVSGKTNKYLDGFNKEFKGDWKTYVKYISEGSATKHREMAAYILKNPDDMGPQARAWAEKIAKHGNWEDRGNVIVTAPPSLWDLTREK